MAQKCKSVLQILVGVALTMQLAGCYYGGDRHYHPWWHHHHDDPEVVVGVHG